MINWIKWDELEKMSGWGLTYSKGEYNLDWDKRASNLSFGMSLGLSDWVDEQQVKAMHLSKEETVLDACCGIGRLTIPMAKYCKSVTGLDAGKKLLAALEIRAKQQNLKNVLTLQKNWYEIEPGVDIPKFDVVMGCNCPALADIKKFSKAAEKRCIYIHGIKGPLPRVIIDDLFKGACSDTLAAPVTEDTGDAEAWTCGRNSFDVTFNRLISLGAAPKVNYAEGGWHVEAATKEALYNKIRPYRTVLPEKEDVFRSNVDRYTVKTSGGVLFERKHMMVVMEWDPTEIDYSLK